MLSFSISLLFHQRKIEVGKAIEKTQVSELLVQERLIAEIRMRRLQQEKTAVQLRALQAQVNPHFLFNSLNTLSSLIDEDQTRAGQFVMQMSVVYRYLLRSNEHQLTSLGNELEFIQSYAHLLETRYGNGFRLNISFDANETSKLLPPLTLQLLVENAVKHNVTSAKRPLLIEIFSPESGQLTVRNNLQRKKTHLISNGVGLTNIAFQYQSLQQPPVVVADDDTHFWVTLPLIEPSADNEA